MSSSTPYDAFAEIYEVWTDSIASLTDANRRFFVERYVETDGPTVELGVGDGRIAVEAAQRGQAMIGVDNSRGMLAKCRERAERAGVADALTLVHADFRDFALPEPAALIAIPFHSIGHLETSDEHHAACRHILAALAPGGRFLFDHFVFDPEFARSRDRVTTLRAEYTAASGRRALLWNTNVIDFERQLITIHAVAEELGSDGRSVERRAHRLRTSWIDPAQSRAMLEATGFEIESALGDFDGTPLGPDSRHQVWIARRPN